MIDFQKELSNFDLTEEKYEQICKDIDSKIDGDLDISWEDLKQKYNLPLTQDTLRKASSSVPFGSKFRLEYFIAKNKNPQETSREASELDVKIDELKKERIKLQTLNTEKQRLDRAKARQELYYDYIGKTVTALPLPEFKPFLTRLPDCEKNYVVALADVHYGARFKSLNNEYSPEIAQKRMEQLTGELIYFINEHKLQNLTIVSLGDLLQGILRLSDLKINDSSVVKATVDVCRLIANMLVKLSAYTNIRYYHTPTANHTQMRVLGAKQSELADEDLEYLMGNYIKDLCAGNNRINVFLAEYGEDYIELYIPGNEIIAMHGHQLKNLSNAVKNVCLLHKKFYDAVLIGHYHNGIEYSANEGMLGDSELLIAPSFIGSDPYSDKLCKGTKSAVKIYCFHKLLGHTETYKIVLN